MSLPMDLYPKRRRISPYLVAALFLFSLCLGLGFFIRSNMGKPTQEQEEEQRATIVVETVTALARSNEVAPPSVTPVPTQPPATSTPTLSPIKLLPTKPPVLDIQTPIPAATFTPAPTAPLGSVLADPLNLRAGPGLDYEIIGTIPKSTRLELLARNQPGDWLQVRLDNGQEGWVYAEYVYTTIDISILQIAAEIPPPPSPTLTP